MVRGGRADDGVLDRDDLVICDRMKGVGARQCKYYLLKILRDVRCMLIAFLQPFLFRLA